MHDNRSNELHHLGLFIQFLALQEREARFFLSFNLALIKRIRVLQLRIWGRRRLREGNTKIAQYFARTGPQKSSQGSRQEKRGQNHRKRRPKFCDLCCASIYFWECLIAKIFRRYLLLFFPFSQIFYCKLRVQQSPSPVEIGNDFNSAKNCLQNDPFFHVQKIKRFNKFVEKNLSNLFRGLTWGWLGDRMLSHLTQWWHIWTFLGGRKTEAGRRWKNHGRKPKENRGAAKKNGNS